MDVLTLPLRGLILSDLAIYETHSHEADFGQGGSTSKVTVSEIHCWISEARAATLTPTPVQLRGLLQLLSLLPQLEILPYVEFQDNEDCTIIDKLAFHVLAAVSVCSGRDVLFCQKAQEGFTSFWQQISTGEYSDLRWTTLIFPLLNGVRRALEQYPMSLGTEQRSVILRSLYQAQVKKSPGASNKQGQASGLHESFMAHTIKTYGPLYGGNFYPFEELVAVRCLSASISQLLFPGHPLQETWESLQRYTFQIATNALDSITMIDSIVIYFNGLEKRLPALFSYVTEIYSETLRLLCLSCCLGDLESSRPVFDIVVQLLSHRTVMGGEKTLSCAVESLLVLIRRFPTLKQTASTSIFDFIITYSPTWDTEVEGTRLPLIRASELIMFAVPDSDMQSLIYNLAKVSRFGLSIGDTQINGDSSASAYSNLNAAYVMSALARFSQNSKISALVVTCLIQTLESARQPSLREDIFYSIVDSAGDLQDEELFLDVIKLLTEESSGINEDNRNTALTAQSKLAKNVRTNHKLKLIYVKELIRLFVAQTITLLDSSHDKKHLNHVQEHVLAILSVLDTLLTTDERDQEIIVMDDLWFACAASSLLSSSPNNLTAWHVDELRRLANRTQRLGPLSLDSLEQELHLSTVAPKLASKMPLDIVKGELVTLCPNVSAHCRHLSPLETLWLTAMARMELYRASTLRITPLMEYVRLGPSTYPLSSCLANVIQSVSTAFISKLKEATLSQALSINAISKELQFLLKLSCDRDANVRTTARTILNEVFVSLPQLLCIDDVAVTLLESLSLLEEASISSTDEQYTPIYEFQSRMQGISIQALDSWYSRKELQDQLTRSARSWLSLAASACSINLSVPLQKYISALSPGKITSLGATLASQYITIEVSPSPIYATSTKGTVTQRLGENDRGDAIDSDDSVCTQLRHLSNQVMAKATPDTIRHLVALPFTRFTTVVIDFAVRLWSSVASAVPACEGLLLSQILLAWTWNYRLHQGLASVVTERDPLLTETQFTPFDGSSIRRDTRNLENLFYPVVILSSFIRCRARVISVDASPYMLDCARIIKRFCLTHDAWTTHPLSREARFTTLQLFLDIVQWSRMGSVSDRVLTDSIFLAALGWFASSPKWSFGGQSFRLESDTVALKALKDGVRKRSHIDSPLATLLQVFLDDEINRIDLWQHPLQEEKKAGLSQQLPFPWRTLMKTAWDVDVTLAAQLSRRFKSSTAITELLRLLNENPERIGFIRDGMTQLLPVKSPDAKKLDLTFLPPVPPIDALRLLTSNEDPIGLQYALRTLEQHAVQLTFFYVPQIVQALRQDKFGYVERFIFETASVSQLFCHQIIWNMKANTYKDDNAEIPDNMKPTYDRMVGMIVDSLSGPARSFYEREFQFFDQVTSISRTLQPFVRKTKAEKKVKIDEEIAKISVDPGVYLPSNPNGVVVDIDRLSGRPLQSHAKTPFMATFRVEREVQGQPGARNFAWQAAMFKVGDDCRQDVLALQIIALCQTIFSAIGLSVQLVPYRVTATGPGSGVIDVIPNATSRDEMGRAKINNLTSFYVSKFGPIDSVQFQKARINFIQSMAAYSVICYLIQIKDRHNGNIMIDETGRIIHIDFGFLFDIDKFCINISSCPNNCGDFYVQECGIKFEPNSFKLSHEMVVLMGGKDSEGFKVFSHLTVKAFLACRPYVEEICSIVSLMMETELPSFKGEGTILRLRERFRPDLNDRSAAEYMEGVIRNAFENSRSVAYDQFQKIQNNIPYAY